MLSNSSKKKQESNNIKQKDNIKQNNGQRVSSIIETTYEKVLSIINNVKDFIKANSNDSNKLIQDLEWVIKVIANKSLYSYELIQPKIVRKNSEFNRFVNFVTKYNDEIIEMNQKHILVSGLLNIVKKGAILHKPSICLKKILPEELRNMDYEKEKEKRNRKKNLINLIGNAILNLYYKTIEKQKKESENKTKECEDKARLNNAENINKLKEDEDDISKISTNDKNRNISHNNRNKNNNVIKIRKKNIVNNYTSYSVGRRKNNNINIKKKLKNDNLNRNNNNPNDNSNYKYLLTEKQNTSESYPSRMNLIKNRNIIKINNNNRFNQKMYNNIDNNKNTNLDLINCEYLIKQKLKKYNNLSHSNNKGDIVNKTYINTNSKMKFQKRIEPLDYTRNKSIANRDYDKTTIKKITRHKNVLENNEENVHIYNNNISKNDVKIMLNKLIDIHFNNMKNIIDKDFDIFDFKSKVGYRNVLPLMCHFIIRSLGLLDRRIITLSKLESFLYSVNDSYKESTLYHNSLHGADVTQSLFVFFINSNVEQICETSVLDLLGMIISAIGHDLGHPGLTNNYHINARSDLALTYNDASCLENFHCSFLFKILQKDETNIFEKLSVDNYKNIRKRMISQILATDMANHGEVMSLIRTKIKLNQEQDQEEEEEESNRFFILSGNEKTKFDEQQVLLNYLMHMADLGHNCKKYEISKQWVKLLCEEFWIQGDKERKLGIPISFLCDRDKIDVPASQVNFLKGFIISSFDSLVEMFPNLSYTMDNAKNNINNWQKLLDKKRKTGWSPEKEDNDEKEDSFLI